MITFLALIIVPVFDPATGLQRDIPTRATGWPSSAPSAEDRAWVAATSPATASKPALIPMSGHQSCAQAHELGTALTARPTTSDKTAAKTTARTAHTVADRRATQNTPSRRHSARCEPCFASTNITILAACPGMRNHAGKSQDHSARYGRSGRVTQTGVYAGRSLRQACHDDHAGVIGGQLRQL